MKRLFFISLFAGLFLFGCSNEDSIVGPVSSDSDNPSFAMSDQSLLGTDGIGTPSFHKKGKKGGKNTGLTVTGLIKAKKSSSLTLNGTYKDGRKKVKVYASIAYPAGAVDEDVTITMNFDPATQAFSFAPSMVFNKNAKLTVKLTGLDLKGVNKKDITFIYYCADGSLETVTSSNIGVNIKKGELKVTNLRIRHFSRFGFVR